MPLGHDGPLMFELLGRVSTPGWNVRLSPMGYLLAWSSEVLSLYNVWTRVHYEFEPTSEHVVGASTFTHRSRS
jgi:hypothetical protein